MTREGPTRRRREWTLTDEAFDRLLSVLDPDPVRAAELYVRIRTKLTFLFESRRCPSPSDLVDATFDRAARKLLDREGEEIRDATAFICSVAQYMLKEDYRGRERKTVSLEDESTVATQDDSAQREQVEQMDVALTDCLEGLAPDERSLIKEYYQGEKAAKKEARVRLARSLGITMNALALRAYRIRQRLKDCVTKRLSAN